MIPLSVRGVARACLKLTGPVSVRRDLVLRGVDGPISLERELQFIRRNHCDLAPSPLTLGEYSVGRLETQVHTPNQADAVNATIYYPATDDGNDVPVASGPKGAPFPLGAYAHGNRNLGFPACPGTPTDTSGDYRRLSTILGHLASWGFVLISVDLSRQPLEALMAESLTASIDYLRSENARSGSPFRHRLDTDRTVLLGHSTGGGAAIQTAAQGNLKVAALALLAPGTNQPSIAASAGAPMIVVRGTHEGAAGVGDSPAKVYAAAAPPKYMVDIQGANHFGYTDNLCLEGGDPPAVLARHDQQRISYGYLTAFLQRYVRGIVQNDLYLRGVVPIEGLESFDLRIHYDGG